MPFVPAGMISPLWEKYEEMSCQPLTPGLIHSGVQQIFVEWTVEWMLSRIFLFLFTLLLVTRMLYLTTTNSPLTCESNSLAHISSTLVSKCFPTPMTVIYLNMLKPYKNYPVLYILFWICLAPQQDCMPVPYSVGLLLQTNFISFPA